MIHKRKKTGEDLVKHFQKRCLERIGIILNQRTLKEMAANNKLFCLQKQSNTRTIFKLSKEDYNGKNMLQFDVVLVYDKARSQFVTCWKYDSDYWFKYGSKKPIIK